MSVSFCREFTLETGLGSGVGADEGADDRVCLVEVSVKARPATVGQDGEPEEKGEDEEFRGFHLQVVVV